MRFPLLVYFACCLTPGLASLATTAHGQEIIVLAGIEETVTWLEAQDWWGEDNRGEQLSVPHAMLVGNGPAWRQTAQQLPVLQKKEIFYRFMLPLIMHANYMVTEGRSELTRMQAMLADREDIPEVYMEDLRAAAVALRITSAGAAAELTQSSDGLPAVIEEALYKLDIIPAGLALGQAAYESGYGTSRFAVEGNAMFGQWTYAGEGLVPQRQRANLGDHRIATFDWPFDSVRSYFVNLMSHPAYENFRRIRARLRAEGKPLSSLVLADGLTSYSERGQEYVDTLKGIIRVNGLDIADRAIFRDEPMRFVIAAENEARGAELRDEIKGLRTSGELKSIIALMRLK
jgi:uncharacterized FlgJ-related protein